MWIFLLLNKTLTCTRVKSHTVLISSKYVIAIENEEQIQVMEKYCLQNSGHPQKKIPEFVLRINSGKPEG